jgi:DNA anti-recombination protein RmuC
MPEIPVNDLTKTLKDAAYVVVGFGVIAFQKAQVRRRELEKQFAEQSETLRTQLNEAASEAEKRFEPVAQSIESSLDTLEERLPEQAREVFKQVRTTAKEAGEQFRSRLSANTAAA